MIISKAPYECCIESIHCLLNDIILWACYVWYFYCY